MRTSKIPKWPQAIDDECRVEPEDPQAIEGDLKGERIAVFPQAAFAAGVQFRKAPVSNISLAEEAQRAKVRSAKKRKGSDRR